MSLVDDLAEDPKAIFSTTPAGVERCKQFIAALDGSLDDLRVFDDPNALADMIDEAELFAVITDDPDALRALDGGPRAFASAVRQGQAIVGIFDPALLSPTAATVSLLRRSDPAAWAPLIDRLARGHLGDDAPACFLEALAPISNDPETWVRALTDAIEVGLDVSEDAPKLLEDWLIFLGRDEREAAAEAVEDARRARLTELERQPGHDVCERCRVLRDELAAAAPGTDDHLRSCLVYAARLLEEGAWNEALAAADDALDVSVRMRDRMFPDVARRLAIGARFGRLEIARAFAELDAVFAPRKASRSSEERLLEGLFGGAVAPGLTIGGWRGCVGCGGCEACR